MAVNQVHRAGVICYAHHRKHRAENFFFIDGHLRGDVIEQRRPDEVALLVALHAEAATVHAKRRPLRFSAVDVAQHLAAVRGGDERPHFVFRRLVQPRPDAQRGNLFFQPGAEAIGGVIAHRQHHRERHAALARRAVGRAHDGVGRHLHVGIRH